MNMTSAYPNLFELLWYTQLPCFDVADYTSAYDDHRFGCCCFFFILLLVHVTAHLALYYYMDVEMLFASSLLG